MKRILPLIVTVLLSCLSYAQFTAIPDSNFEQELIAQGYDNTLDGQVLTSNISGITFLNLTGDPNFNTNQNEIGLNISDLTGIKAFSSLQTLWAQGNDLIELDLEGMVTLIDIRAFFNDLERININGLTNLEIMGLNVNNISGVNVSTNTNLRIFDIAQNNLMALDIRGLNALTEANFQNNAQLNCILVDDSATAISYNNNAAFRKNGATVFSDTCTAIYTQIPDRNFEQSLIDQGFDTEGGIPNGLVLTMDIQSITNLDISNSQINDLSGLEAFSALEILDVSDNALNKLELQNSTLREIRANNCALGGKSIRFQNNPPSGSFLTNVELLELKNNAIGSSGSTISFGGVPNVRTLDVSGNSFGTIQLSETTSIETLIANNCPNLFDLANLNALSALTYLDTSFCNISTIDISQNVLLNFVDLANNNLSSLSAITNNSLVTLNADDNTLTAIDLPETASFQELFLENNALTSLDLSKVDTNLVTMSANDNSALSCIQVSNVASAEAETGWFKDAAAVYATNCSTVDKIVEVVVVSGQAMDTAGNYVITSANQPIQLGFNLRDENDDELDAGVLPNYAVNITTVESTTQNPAKGGNVTVTGVDFELLSNEPIQITTMNNAVDGTRTVAMQGDQLFEADEFFSIEISTTDPNITLKNAESGVVRIPVKIVDNEVTNINLELVNNGAEPDQNATLRITSSLVNNTGAPLPFSVALGGGSAILGEDYQDLTNQPEIPNGASSVEFDVIVIDNDTAPEDEEDFLVTIDYAGSIADNRVVVQNENQVVTITDDGNTTQGVANLSAVLGGDVQNSNGNYTIEEGGTIEILIEATNSNEVDGQSFSFDYDISSNGEAEDFTINSPNPYVFTVNDAVDPDGKLSIIVNSDNLNDAGEFINITLFGTPDETVVWDGQFFDDESGTYKLELPQIEIIDTPDDSTTILAEIDNTGGTEGQLDANNTPLPDIFTLQLKNLDGTPYVAQQDIVFPVSFASATTNPAEDGDYVPRALSIRVLANSSSGTVEVDYPDEMQPDTEHEFYVVTLAQPSNFNDQISLPEPFNAKIIDDEGKFIIYHTVKTKDNTNPNYFGDAIFVDDNTCCPQYNVEEGEIFEIGFEAEKGVPEDTEFGIKVTFGAGGALGNYNQAIENEDFRNRDSTADITDEFFYDSDRNQEPDNTLQIAILSADVEPNKDPEGIEQFDINYSVVDADKYVLSANSPSSSRTVVILETIPAAIVATNNVATENPLSNGEFIITLDDATDSDLRIFYEIDENSTAQSGEDADFEPLVGYVDIMAGDTMAMITVIPIDDPDVEEDESLILRLIDGSGYSVKGSGSASITIESDDVAPVSATIETIDTQAFEADSSNTGEFEIRLDQANPDGADTTIAFEIVTGRSSDAQPSDYILLDANRQPLTGPNEVTIFGGTTSTRLFVQAIEDNLQENDENVRLRLTPGVGYSIGSPNQDFVEIVSSSFDETTFDPKTIRVTAQSAICASKDEGGILVENSSGFRFKVVLTKESDASFQDEMTLEGNSDINFTELLTGTYTLTFENLTNPQLSAPGFTVQIQKQEAISVNLEGIDLEARMGHLMVSGSTAYVVSTNQMKHYFSFDSTDDHLLSVPLENGMNSITIEGLANCQGKINKQLFLNESYVYPNPTRELFNILGVQSGEVLTIKIADASGKVLYEEQKVVQDSMVTLSLLNFQAGMYFGQVTSASGHTLDFKIIKEN